MFTLIEKAGFAGLLPFVRVFSEVRYALLTS